MKEPTPNISLPPQEEGAEKNIETTEELTNIEEAKELFSAAKNRLFDVNQWDKICGN